MKYKRFLNSGKTTSTGLTSTRRNAQELFHMLTGWYLTTSSTIKDSVWLRYTYFGKME